MELFSFEKPSNAMEFNCSSALTHIPKAFKSLQSLHSHEVSAKSSHPDSPQVSDKPWVTWTVWGK